MVLKKARLRGERDGLLRAEIEYRKTEKNLRVEFNERIKHLLIIQTKELANVERQNEQNKKRADKQIDLIRIAAEDVQEQALSAQNYWNLEVNRIRIFISDHIVTLREASSRYNMMKKDMAKVAMERDMVADMVADFDRLIKKTIRKAPLVLKKL